MNYLEALNPEQRAAVEAGEGPILILAGAGSGKTRVLTQRIAHLIHHYKIDPAEILAVTFTNKAAAEMRHRIFQLLQDLSDYPLSETELWVSTFHSACVRILRSDIHHIGYSNQFSIYDDSDQLSVVKAAMKELNISDVAVSPKVIQGRIGKLKNDGIDHTNYTSHYGGPVEDAFVRVFERYAEVLKKSSALDFGDLILLTVRLFQQAPQVLAKYQNRFRHVLIDEYQDTNKSQYQLIKMFAGSRRNVCAVGDEDQSIYGWRGADITNILNFEKDFPNAKIFKLEENYRSTKNIIEAASQVISYNTERRDKQLWTKNIEGEKISLLECYDEHDEAIKVTAEIKAKQGEGETLGQMAIFYRTNAQSRVIEDMLRASGMNYRIYGGLKFYERLEVKDSLAYLKLLANPADDVSFRRIVNVPARGIGAVSMERFSLAARERGVSHWQLLSDIFAVGSNETVDLGRAKRAFRQFFDLVDGFQKAKASLLPSDLLNLVLEDTGYRKSLVDENTSESQSRLENLSELRQSVVEYELRVGAEEPDKAITLEGFLETIALVSDIDKFEPDAPAISLMTIHMAKGLEFDVVFLVGLEEELFPNIRPWEGEDPSDIEEERRLCYVGMTRARKKLYLLYAKNRTVFGVSHFRVVSRFVQEIPENFIEAKKADYFSRRRHYLDKPGLPPREPRDDHQEDFSQVYGDEYNQDSQGDENPSALKAGSRVVHPTFGEGIVRERLSDDKVVVEFSGHRFKKISLKFSQLKVD